MNHLINALNIGMRVAKYTRCVTPTPKVMETPLKNNTKLLRMIFDLHMVRIILELFQNRNFTFTTEKESEPPITGNGKQRRLRRLENGFPQGSVLTPSLQHLY